MQINHPPPPIESTACWVRSAKSEMAEYPHQRQGVFAGFFFATRSVFLDILQQTTFFVGAEPKVEDC